MGVVGGSTLSLAALGCQLWVAFHMRPVCDPIVTMSNNAADDLQMYQLVEAIPLTNVRELVAEGVWPQSVAEGKN